MKIADFLHELCEKIEKNYDQLTQKEKIYTLESILNSDTLKRKGCALLSFFIVLNSFGALAKKNGNKAANKNSYIAEEVIDATEDTNDITEKAYSIIEANYEEATNEVKERIVYSESMSLVRILTNSLIAYNELEEQTEIDEPIETEEPVAPVITNDDKIMAICEAFNLTIDQFNVIKGVVIAEAQSYSYEDAYAVINTIYNRSICSRWIYDIDRIQGEGLGTNMYNQVIQKGQFDPYWYSGSYKKYVDASYDEQPAVMAIIDFFCGTEPTVVDGKIQILPQRLHDYVNFVGYKVSHKYNAESFTSRGNQYGVHIKEDEYVTDQFISISEEDVEKRAQEVEAYCKEYREYLNQGMDHEEIMQLMLTKDEN